MNKGEQSVRLTAQEATGSYTDARHELLERPGALGSPRRKALSGLTDDWLRALYVASGAGEIGAALVAVGGYGRTDLAPGSDLDLLLLHQPSVSPSDLTAVADRLWYPVWDAGLKLDHSVRVPAEARRLAAADLRVLLGLLDARTVAGDDSLTKFLRESVLGDWRALAPRRLEELHRGVEERTARSGELAHLLEPDLKDSYGGLRDLVALRAVAASWVTDAPVSALAAQRDFLLDVRDALHLVTGRATDRLMQQEQVAVAARLGLSGDDPADELLRAVSSAGRAVAYAADTTWHRVERLTRRTGVRGVLGALAGSGSTARRLRGSVAERAPLADGVVVQDGEAVLAADARPERDPVLVLRAAAAAAQAGMRLSPHAVERLARDGASLPEPWPASALDSLVSLLGAGRPALPVWEALDQADFWSRLIPEWSVVRSAPQRNPVHRFTVDRHLVETAVNAAAHTRRVGRPDLLLVGALLHDIGKGRPGDHTDIGVVLVSEMAPRMGFGPEDTETLVALVRHHLLLPDTATRRDLDDPATVDSVAAAVQSEEVLDLLHALTEADAAATGPAAWSEWKKSLIEDLVARTRAVLAGRPHPSDVGAFAAEARIAEAVRATSSEGVAVLLDEDEVTSVTTVTVAAPDRTGLLSIVAGVLSLHRLQVRGAQVDTVTASDGTPRAVQVWTVTPAFGDPPPVERLREDISRAVLGTMDVAARLDARESAYPAPVGTADPSVKVVPGASDRATVLEVRAHDAPALLHRITRAIAAADVMITAARVATLGSEVVDVFYLVDRAGLPLAQSRSDALVVTVLGALARD
ncbi:MAG: [protein-PII] uridylyltransferase [Actinobacteria bacterium]|nr:[protein-PII] uridylyltransferase [Actinomycetota bacterium]